MPRVYFEEIQCKSLLNRVEGMPFTWTINPYRGCQHACVYCYARRTHEYFGYDVGNDFNSRIIVKVNAVEVLREELRRPSWKRETVLLGSNVDPYQPAEKHYRLTRRILMVLRDHLTPVNILTKNPLIARDLDVLRDLAKLGLVRAMFSVGTLNQEVWRKVEPGAPNPRDRLKALGTLARADVPTGVMLAPIMPELSDSEESIEEVISEAVRQGARFINPIVLHLRPGTKEWFLSFFEEAYPELYNKYRQMYPRSYAPKKYVEEIQQRAGTIRSRWLAAAGLPRECPRAGQLAFQI